MMAHQHGRSWAGPWAPLKPSGPRKLSAELIWELRQLGYSPEQLAALFERPAEVFAQPNDQPPSAAPMPSKERNAQIVDMFNSGETFASISVQLGCSEQTVSGVIFRAREKGMITRAKWAPPTKRRF